jgi:hypothetical protein
LSFLGLVLQENKTVDKVNIVNSFFIFFYCFCQFMWLLNLPLTVCVYEK